jgi:anti-sigma factor RsiW
MNEHLTTNTLIDYVHGELPSAEDALAHTHLQSCTECRSEFERETRLSEALRFAAAEDERELPSMVKAEIWQAVRAARPSPYARFATWLQPLVAVPAAAILVAVVYFASPLGHQAPAPLTVDASYYLEQHAAEQMNPLGERNVTPAVLETSDTGRPDPSVGSRTAVAAAVDAVE